MTNATPAQLQYMQDLIEKSVAFTAKHDTAVEFLRSNFASVFYGLKPSEIADIAQPIYDAMVVEVRAAVAVADAKQASALIKALKDGIGAAWAALHPESIRRDDKAAAVAAFNALLGRAVLTTVENQNGRLVVQRVSRA